MPYQLTWETNSGAHKRFYGVLTVEDVVNSSIELHRDHRFDRLRYSINDFSEVTSVPTSINPSALDDLAAASIGASMTNPKLRVAIVTTHEMIEKLSRHFLEATDGVWQSKVFPTLAAARLWLGEHRR